MDFEHPPPKCPGMTISGLRELDLFHHTDDLNRALPSQIVLLPVRVGDHQLYAASTTHVGDPGEMAYWRSRSPFYNTSGIVLERFAICHLEHRIHHIPLPEETEEDPDRRFPGDFVLLDQRELSRMFLIRSMHKDLSRKEAVSLLKRNQKGPYFIEKGKYFGSFRPAVLIGRLFQGSITEPKPKEAFLSLDPPTGPPYGDSSVVAVTHYHGDGYVCTPRWYGPTEEFELQMHTYYWPERAGMFTILQLINPADLPPDMKTGQNTPEIYYPASPFEPWNWCFMDTSQHEKTENLLRKSNPEWLSASASFPGLCGIIQKQVGFP